MTTTTGFFVLLLAIAVVESNKHKKHMPITHDKLFNLLAKLDNVDQVLDLNIRRWYQMVYEAATWMDAREACVMKGGKLATPKTIYEFKLIQNLVRRMRFDQISGASGTKRLAWVGFSSLEDWTIWRTVDGNIHYNIDTEPTADDEREGNDIRLTGFSMWARGSGIISPDPTEHHCAGIDPVNLLRDYWCDRKQPYVCEYKLPAEDSKSDNPIESADPTNE